MNIGPTMRATVPLQALACGASARQEPSAPRNTLSDELELENSLCAVEGKLAELTACLVTHNLSSMALLADELTAALLTAVNQFAKAALNGPVSAKLRQRLIEATGLVASHRDALASATAALDRAIDVLIPEPRSRISDLHQKQTMNDL
jgi:hypothetical protein